MPEEKAKQEENRKNVRKEVSTEIMSKQRIEASRWSNWKEICQDTIMTMC